MSYHMTWDLSYYDPMSDTYMPISGLYSYNPTEAEMGTEFYPSMDITF